MAITWQNINAPVLADPSRSMALAQNSFGGAFDTLAKALETQQTVNQNAIDQQNAAKALGFKELLQGASTVEELAALKASGRLDSVRQDLPTKFREALLGASDARLASLQNQTTANNTFENNQRIFRDAPVLDQGEVLAAKGDVVGYEAWRAANPNVRGTAALVPKLQSGALAAVNNPLAIKEATLKNDLFPVTSANAREEAQLKAIQLKAQGTEATNTVQDQLVNKLTTKAAQEYQDNQLTGRLKLSPIATKLGLPLDSSGSPDWENMTKDQRMLLNHQAIVAGITNGPVDGLFSGDTVAANSFLTSLRNTPGVSPDAVSRNLGKINSSFSTVSNGAPIGNDARTIEKRAAQTEVVMNERMGRNRFAPNSPDALTAYEKLATEVPNIVPKDAQEDLPAIQTMLGRFATEGIEVRPGVFITPSVQDVLTAVRGYSPSMGGNFFNNTQAQEIENTLKKNLNSSGVTDLLQQSEEARMFQRQKAVKNLLNPPASK